jgi:hypothetical protein
LRASTLEAFASLEDADLPPDIEEKASGMLGKERVIWRDI